MNALPVRAYTDKLSYEAGDGLTLHVDTCSESVDVRLVRMLDSGSSNSDLDYNVPWSAAGTYHASSQLSCVGSFMSGDVSQTSTTDEVQFTLGAYVWSSNFDSPHRQTIIAANDSAAVSIVLAIEDRALTLTAIDDEVELWSVTATERIIDHSWYFVAGAFDGLFAHVWLEPVDSLYGRSGHDQRRASVDRLSIENATVGARRPESIERTGQLCRGRACDNLNAKVEAPFIARRALPSSDVRRMAASELTPADVFGDTLIAEWDFAPRDAREDREIARALVGGQPDGLFVNLPARGVTGRHFTGDVITYTQRPSEFAAAHFHETDLIDVGWNPTLHEQLPEDLESGVYGVVVSARDGSGSDTTPIVVVPKSSDQRNRIALLLPTFSYLAYANENLFNGLDTSAMTDQEVLVAAEDEAHVGDSSFGLSMYDTHPDGSGVIYSSARRQIVNLRRGYRMWLNNAGRGFSADMYLVEWLARQGFTVDVITDHEVHVRGAAYLDPYATIISGSHPEYTSRSMLTTLQQYRDDGGSLMYLGGNGWYWVTGVYSGDPLIAEIRRGYAGIRCWESYPGEVTLMSTGEPGGLWRHRGCAPQKLVGVGMAAQGWGSSEPYYRTNAQRPDLKWILDGVEENPIGSYGASMGGAAGDELDRADHALGTPPGAVVLASSRDHSNFYQRALEEIAMNLPGHGGGQQDPDVRADIVYFQTPAGGEVFSVGSIAWSGALLHNNADNGVSRITANVIRRFVNTRS
ncbi:N,N-dimethylformamidase beta subunit family domain-containing protein [Rhodococcus sp. JS3073]|uniref:N,N-dimethylformamidase beta subunit family domain-containing protein n=1 Tax=Rhodococcus sp. JS3073 TaxID=3002901 RepID=UPI002285E002|nr:N,N-dimethylformamidase beta subunit family domain-containing protein [Rhodococcus sp. JS3073]WAM19566.1 hypothetical protein OYT95_38500 [Rhodococcus sp. JS3073]